MLDKPASGVDPETGSLNALPLLGSYAYALQRFGSLIYTLNIYITKIAGLHNSSHEEMFAHRYQSLSFNSNILLYIDYVHSNSF